MAHGVDHGSGPAGAGPRERLTASFVAAGPDPASGAEPAPSSTASNTPVPRSLDHSGGPA